MVFGPQTSVVQLVMQMSCFNCIRTSVADKDFIVGKKYQLSMHIALCDDLWRFVDNVPANDVAIMISETSPACLIDIDSALAYNANKEHCNEALKLCQPT